MWCGASAEPNLRSNIRRLLKEYMPQNDETLDMQLSALVDGSDFPFNRSYTKDLVIGGRDVNLDLHGELFIGTNFDCNQKYFNYEGLAEVTGSVTLFTETANVFTAEAIYGADNGVHLADQFSLVFLGRTVIDQPFPQVDCMEHTYNLFHTSPVISGTRLFSSFVAFVLFFPFFLRFRSLALDSHHTTRHSLVRGLDQRDPRRLLGQRWRHPQRRLGLVHLRL